MESTAVYKASAVAATTATLIPQLGSGVKGDLADTLTNIVLTFTTARDDKFFDVTNREYVVTIKRR
jgi:hypothetical protein